MGCCLFTVIYMRKASQVVRNYKEIMSAKFFFTFYVGSVQKLLTLIIEVWSGQYSCCLIYQILRELLLVLE